ncbi:MAG: Rne/Rng family ribonuclease [Proteobacteria bacterium]|nr:Rne/Rng family ribonuclease [Pseudomonadota bacterium]
MTRKILINGRREEELRVAIVENQTLEDFEIETKHSGLLRNNIYRGVVSSIAPSLNAAFVDFGEAKNGFLAFNDVVESAYSKHVKDASRISDILTVGQELIVQVIKDAGGLKGAQVTTNISIAGRYLVLRPKDAKSGVSRKVDDDARADLTQKIRSLDLPEGYGCIVRTNAMDQSRAILLRDARVLVQLWHKIEAEFARGKGPQLLYNDQDIVVQAMRDYFDATINEVLIDDKSCFERAKAYVRATFENGEDKLKYYDDKMPLFTRYGIEKQIEQIYARTVSLPSGGFIVIDPTEALTAIDVNSAHSTKRETQDLTAYHTNLEAAVEIARQLRMRDIGGLIVIDFIDMRQGKHQRDVERVMRNAMSRDKARSKVERISANGLLEINRQRISQALSMRTHLECPTCGGRGFIPSAEAIGMTLIREIDARAVNGELGGVIIKLHPDIAQQLQNERRLEFAQLELEYGIRIEIVGTRDISRGDESIEWLTKRQENELHPERVANQAQDATSIIDVAEVYQSDDAENAYRPNDFEEFSSEEARKRRAEKRAARREMAAREAAKAAADNNADASESVADSCKSCEAPVEMARPAAVKENREVKKVTNARSQTGLAILGTLLAQMKDHIVEETRTESGRSRRFSFRNRRHAAKSENGIQSDLRLFAMDLLKSVCVTACGCTTDVTRREMLDRLVEASDWLIGSAQTGPESAAQAANAIRNQISSRHATARLSSLFDAAPASQPDEIGKLLLTVRKEAFNDEEKVTENRLRALNRHLAYRISDIFAPAEAENVKSAEKEVAQPVQPAKPEAKSVTPAFDVSMFEEAVEDIDIDELREVLQEAPAPVVKEEPAFSGAVLATNSVPTERRSRMRGRRRAAIGECEEAFISKDAQVITADVPIAPMTKIVEPQDTAELENAITQEIPAVKSGRSVRRTRVNAQPVEVAPVETAPVTVEEKAEKTSDAAVSENREGARRVRRTRRIRPENEAVVEVAETVKPTMDESPEVKGSGMVEVTPEVDVAAAATDDASVAVETPVEDLIVRTRRVRKTRRAMQSESAEAVAAPAEVVEAVATPVEVAEAVAAPVDAPVVEQAAEPANVRRTERTTRRTRSTRKPAVQETAEVKAEVVETPAPVEAEKKIDVREPEVIDKPRLDAVELLNASHGEANRSTRRVRKTRPAMRRDLNATNELIDKINEKVVEQFSDATDDFNAAAQEFNNIMSEIASNAGDAAKADEEKAVSTAREFCKSTDEFQAEAAEFKKIVDGMKNDEIAPVKETTKTTRRVRRTRHAVSGNAVAEVKSEPQVIEAESKPEPVQESVETVEMIETGESAERTRTRRTRRARPTDV